MRLLFDLETASCADLKKTGAHAYAEDPSTRVTVLCFAIDGGPVKTWTGGPPPSRFTDAVSHGSVIVAHNYLFEFNVYHCVLVPQGWPPIPLAQWSCTMARALVAGYPAGLEAAGAAAGIAVQKDSSAHGLMLRFARPRSVEPLTWWHETDPARFKALCDYCARDVEALRGLDAILPELSPRERAIFERDHHINQRGLGIDHGLVERLAGLTDSAKRELTADIRRLTNGRVVSLGQVAKLKNYLLDGHSVDVPDMRRGTMQNLLAGNTLSRPARSLVEARLAWSRSSTAKLASITSARSADGRVRGCFQYYGARTGRWSGRRVQPQNFYRGSVGVDVPDALGCIAAGADAADLDMLFSDTPLGVVASCLRSTIVAAPGNRLCLADFSQIEARVLAWLAGQEDALSVFRANKDIYTETAKAIGSPSRQLGKVLTLACGFGMSWRKFVGTARGYGVILTEAEADAAVMAWRAVNWRIVNYWWDTHKTLLRVTAGAPGTSERCGKVTMIRRSDALLMRLPSGRHLVYRQPKLIENPQGHPEFVYMGGFGGAWTEIRMWPGKEVENITQAVARDLMCDAILALPDVPLVGTVHDELVAETAEAEAEGTLDRMLAVMKRSPAWAAGLPVNAAGLVTRRYAKG